MALPASGPLSFSAIRTEFADTNPVSMTEFYGLGSPALPASGLIKASDFHGVSAVTDAVKLSTIWTPSNFNFAALSICSVTFQPDGSITVVKTSGTSPAADNWWTGNPSANIGASYDVRYTASTGTWSNKAAAINVWIQMNIARTWDVRVLAKNAPAVKSANNVTFEIRLTGSGLALASISGCSHSALN